jgi:hypothetical protein
VGGTYSYSRGEEGREGTCRGELRGSGRDDFLQGSVEGKVEWMSTCRGVWRGGGRDGHLLGGVWLPVDKCRGEAG